MCFLCEASNELARKFNWQGRGEKQGFAGLALNTALRSKICQGIQLTSGCIWARRCTSRTKRKLEHTSRLDNRVNLEEIRDELCRQWQRCLPHQACCCAADTVMTIWLPCWSTTLMWMWRHQSWSGCRCVACCWKPPPARARSSTRFIHPSLDTYPILGGMATIVLTVPVTSVNCERGISTYNTIKTDGRASLKVSSVEGLINFNLNAPSVRDFPYEIGFQVWTLTKRHICLTAMMKQEVTQAAPGVQAAALDLSACPTERVLSFAIKVGRTVENIWLNC